MSDFLGNIDLKGLYEWLEEKGPVAEVELEEFQKHMLKEFQRFHSPPGMQPVVQFHVSRRVGRSHLRALAFTDTERVAEQTLRLTQELDSANLDFERDTQRMIRMLNA